MVVLKLWCTRVFVMGTLTTLSGAVYALARLYT